MVQIFTEKLIIIQMFKKFDTFMESEGTLSFSQYISIESCPQFHAYYFFKINFNNILPSTSRPFKWPFFLRFTE
jgi:hypothetical protein